MQPAINLLDELPEIRPFPETAGRIVAACNRGDSTAQELCGIIQCDAAITLKLLKIANSSVYGMSGRVTSLQRAVVVLGFRAVRNLALAAAAEDVFTSDGGTLGQTLWKHSLACASVATLLAKADRVSAEEAFLAGIVHDAGKLILFDAYGENYLEVAGGLPSEQRIAAERERFGTDHQELGLRCADEWGLPMEVADAISNHHDPLDAEDFRGLVDVITVANGLAQHWGVGGLDAREIDVERMVHQSPLSLKLDDLTELQERSLEGFDTLQASFAN